MFEASTVAPWAAPGAEDGVDLVDEEDRVRALLHRGDERLEARLEVAAVARAGQQRAEVEREDLGVARGPRARRRRRCAARGPRRCAVFPTPVSPTKIGLFLRRRARMWTVRSSSLLAADQRIERAPRRRARSGSPRRPSSGSSGAPRRRRRCLRPRPRARAPRLRAAQLRDAVRDVLEHVEARDALRAQQRDRVRVGLLEDARRCRSPASTSSFSALVGLLRARPRPRGGRRGSAGPSRGPCLPGASRPRRRRSSRARPSAAARRTPAWRSTSAPRSSWSSA